MTPRDLFRQLTALKKTNPTALARKAGQSSLQTALSRWLNDPTHDIRTETLEPIARALEVPLEALLTELGATRYAQEIGLLPLPPTPVAQQRAKVYQVKAPSAPDMTLPAAVARVRSALLAVPEDRRIDAAMVLIGQLGNRAVAPRTVAAALEAAASKHRRV